MKSNWRVVTLGEISTQLSDGLHKAPLFVPDGEYIFVNATNLENGMIVDKDPQKHTNYGEFLKYGVPLNDRTILYSIDGTIGNIARYKGEKCVLGKGACYISVAADVDVDYIYYQLQSPHFKSYIESMSTGSTIRHISLKTMRNYAFQLPDISIQKKVGRILAIIDEKITVNRKINDNLSEMLQSIYQQRFSISYNGEEHGVLADICDYSKDRISVSSLSVSNYYSTENMLPGKGGAVEASSLPTIAQTTKCKMGDILISNIRPYFRKIVYCQSDCGCSTDVLCFTPKSSALSAYLFSTLYADRFFDFMVAGSKGTKMPRGDKQQIMTYAVHIPTDEELDDFNELAKPLLARIESNRLECFSLSALRDGLLPKLMSGEIDVSDIQL